MLKKILLAIVLLVLVFAPISGADAIAINNPKSTFATASFYTIVNNVASFMIGFIVILAIIFLVWGGIQYVTAGGDEKQIDKAKSTIIYAIIGLFVAGIAFAVVSLVLKGLIGNSAVSTPPSTPTPISTPIFPVPTSTPVPTLAPTPALTPTPVPTVTLNMAEISKHNTRPNCWMVIGGKVYTLAGYMAAHPGGIAILVMYCGKDGTAAYAGLPHSPYASSLLPPYFLGNFGATIRRP